MSSGGLDKILMKAMPDEESGSVDVSMLNEGQKKAFDGIVKSILDGDSSYNVLEGYAGSGKTFVTVRIAKALVAKGKRLLVTAPTWKALKVLRKNFIDVCGGVIDARVEFRTVHSAFGLRPVITPDGYQEFERDFSLKTIPVDDYRILFVDEMSMLDNKLFGYIDNEVNDNGLKVLFIGDPAQIPPVNHENSVPCSEEGREEYDMKVYTLDTIVRQAADNPIIQVATQVRENLGKVRSITSRENKVIDRKGVMYVSQGDLNDLLDSLFTDPAFDEDPDYAKVIAWTNDTVNKMNKKIRVYRYGAERARKRLVVGEMLIADNPIVDEDTDRVIFNTNDELLVVSLSTAVEKVNEGTEDEMSLTYYKAVVKMADDKDDEKANTHVIRVLHEDSIGVYNEILKMLVDAAKRLPKGSFKAKEVWKEYYAFKESWAEVKYNYAITAHKSQGSTYKNAVVIESDINKNPKLFERNRIKYTACTRPSELLFIV